MLSNEQKILNESIFVNDIASYRAYNNLSESTKEELNKELVSSMFLVLKKKEDKMDYAEIDKSKGSIINYKYYESMNNSLDSLNILCKKYGIHSKEIDIVTLAMRNVKENKKYFLSAYAKDNKAVISLYRNLVSSIMFSISYLIAIMVDYSRLPNGDYEIICKENSNKELFVLIKNLDDFNKSVASGSFYKAMNTTTENVSGSLVFAAIVIPPVALMIIVQLIRLSIYYFYETRVTISDCLRQQAMFVEANLSETKVKTMSKKTKSKQEKVIKELIKIADKIDVDSDLTKRNVKADMKNDEKVLASQSIDNVMNPVNNNLSGNNINKTAVSIPSNTSTNFVL